MYITQITGKAFHLAIDLTLFAGFLSGIKKNTGLTPDFSQFGEPTVEKWATKYLDYGDKVYDNSVAFMNSSNYFVKYLF